MKFPSFLGLVALTALFFRPLGAETMYVAPLDFYLDPPEGWTFLEEPTTQHLFLTDPNHEAVFQVFIREPNNLDPGTAGKGLMEKLQASGEQGTFNYQGLTVWLASLEFSAGPGPVTGWGLIVPWKGQHLTILAFAPGTNTEFILMP